MTTLVQAVADAIASDDEDQSPRLIETYQALTAKQREAVDNVFICLCGWSLKTLAERHPVWRRTGAE